MLPSGTRPAPAGGVNTGPGHRLQVSRYGARLARQAARRAGPLRRAARPRAALRFLLGIDGGATKTLAGVLDLERGRLHLGHGGPSNQDAVGVRAAGEALFGAADEALAGAGIADEQLDAAVLAVAGTDTEAVVAHVRAERSREWMVVGDVVGAWATATGARPGVGAIAGTGSNVFGVGATAAGGAPAGGVTSWATRARATGTGCSRSRRRCATASAPARRRR